jgi:hypothetical protein
MKPVGKPDAGNPHVRFDERGGETGCFGDTAPLLDSTGPRTFSVLKTCLSCRSTEAERAIAPVWPAVQDKVDTMCDSCRVQPEDDGGEQNPPPGKLILSRLNRNR